MPEDAPKNPESKGLKSTLNLPRTPFPMKANLPVNEPLRLKQWQDQDLYGQIRAARAGAPKYILHDGPPYANGPLHLGHALNKCIKDFVVKTKTMAGFDAPYVPGWDCHGLPIEIKVDEQLGRKKLEMDPLTVRQACREYARKYVDLQRAQFERIGVFGRWHDPYLTMSNEYEAKIVECFYSFLEQGFVYKGLKPVFWCIHDRTALAEAEVEYEQHTSPSVYIRYRLTSDPDLIHHELGAPPSRPHLGAKVGEAPTIYTIIWTTTPWTIPASQAVAFNPQLEYVALACSTGTYIVAQALLSAVITHCNLMSAANPDEPASQADIVALFSGERLEHATFQHPFFDRSILGVTAAYVTADQGTGAVHTAPAHGVDDFHTGKRYGLPELQYVDNAGRQRNTNMESFEGLTVFKSNAPITELLKEKGALLAATHFEHSYPHCWRCHNPVIVRATEQWFIGMETPMQNPDGTATTYRQRALEEIDTVTWDPAWGRERIANMIATRPDWCISRQRIWGVPIAVFLCERCGEPLKDAAINRHIVGLFQKESADAWYKYSAEELLPARTVCACGGHTFRKEMDILDVWFESGSSWHAVLEPEGDFPADLYTEGGDQHRGWFHSSLLTSVAMRNEAPYKMVATSGWTLDEQGRAFSKSLGNGVDPVDIAKRLGGEIVRLWVASVDFREDVAASENLMQRVSENYRKLRNTLRFLLSNLYDFIPAEHEVKFEAMQPLDQYILARLAEVDKKIRAAYDAFEFHRAYHALNEFTNTDLSALYLDVLKDRLYTYPIRYKEVRPDQQQLYLERRSAQTALWHIAEALTLLIAPILSFTADEVWALLPTVAYRKTSVHFADFPCTESLVPDDTSELMADWKSLLAIRSGVLRHLESDRKQGLIGKGLEAAVAIAVTQQHYALLHRYQEVLPELFGVSFCHIGEPLPSSMTVEEHLEQSVIAFADSTNSMGEFARFYEVENEVIGINSEAAGADVEAEKCDRCWRYTKDCLVDMNEDSTCARCYEALDARDYYPSGYELEARA